MSHFHKLFIDRPRGFISHYSLSVLSASSALLICMEMMIFEAAPVLLLFCHYRGVKREKNGADNKRSEVLVSVKWAGTSFILFQIGFGWLEITFSPSWHGEVNSFEGEHRVILF